MQMVIKNIFLLLLIIFSFSVQAAREMSSIVVDYNKKYELYELAKTAEDLNRAAPEKAFVKISRSADILEITVEMTDADCFNRSTANQQTLHSNGDTVRFFLQAANHTALYELQVDCNNRRSAFFHWGAGSIFYSAKSSSALPSFRSHAEKTSDGWKCTLFVPLDEAAELLKLQSPVKWRVMLMRYNYGKNHPVRDVSSFPQAIRIPDADRFATLAD